MSTGTPLERTTSWSYQGRLYRIVWDQKSQSADLSSETHLRLAGLHPLATLAAGLDPHPASTPARHAGYPEVSRLAGRRWRKLLSARRLLFLQKDHLVRHRADALEIVTSSSSGAPTLRFELTCSPRHVEIRTGIENVSGRTLRCESILPCMCRLFLERADSGWSMFKMSSNTSTPSGSVRLDESERGFGFRWLPAALLPGFLRRMLYLPGESSSWRRGFFSSQWFTLLARNGNGPALLLGFVGSRRHFSTVTVDRRSGLLYGTAHLEGIEIPPGGAFEAHRFVMIFGDTPFQCLETYMEEYSSEAPRRRCSVSLWGSWNAGFHDRFSARDLEENLEGLARRDAPPLVEYFQLDDGYQKSLGDWLETNSRLPYGLEAFARLVHDKGLKPAIWLAPFAVSKDSSVFKNHPDWLVKNSSGRPAIAGLMPGRLTLRPYFGLDVTVPEAGQWLATLFHTLVEWGFMLFKLDYLAAGALRGHRADPCCTSAQAYSLGLSIIRNAVGDLPLMGALAPLLAGAGWMDIQRVSTDVSFAGNSWLKQSQRLLGDPITPCVRNNIRNNLARAFLHNRIWTNDCDAVVYEGLSPEERRTHLSVSLLAGGVCQIGHDVRKGPYFWEDLARLRDYVTVELRVPDLFERAFPEEILGISENAHSRERYLFYLLLNSTDRACLKQMRDPSAVFDDFRIDWPSGHDFWQDRRTSLRAGDTIEIAPHGCRLFFFKILPR
jgi:hypothetical protein